MAIRRIIVIDDGDHDKIVELAQPSTGIMAVPELPLPDAGYMSLKAFLKSRGLGGNDKHYSGIGKAITRVCKERNVEIRKTDDPRWGTINTYPVSIIKEFFDVDDT